VGVYLLFPGHPPHLPPVPGPHFAADLSPGCAFPFPRIGLFSMRPFLDVFELASPDLSAPPFCEGWLQTPCDAVFHLRTPHGGRFRSGLGGDRRFSTNSFGFSWRARRLVTPDTDWGGLFRFSGVLRAILPALFLVNIFFRFPFSALDVSAPSEPSIVMREFFFPFDGFPPFKNCYGDAVFGGPCASLLVRCPFLSVFFRGGRSSPFLAVM